MLLRALRHLARDTNLIPPVSPQEDGDCLLGNFYNTRVKKSPCLGAQSCLEGKQPGKEGSWWVTDTFPPTMGPCQREHPVVWGRKAFCGAHRPAENCKDETGGQGLEVERSQHLQLHRAPQGRLCRPYPEVPSVPVRHLGLGLALSKLTASCYFINMEEQLFINPLLSFRVNRKSSRQGRRLLVPALLSPSRQTVPRAGPSIFC